MTKGENPMMILQNKTLGQQFLEVLNASKEDKEKMFTLLRSTLEKVNPFPTEKVDFTKVMQNVTEQDSIATMRAAKASFNAKQGAYMFSEDYIYLTAKAYKEQGMGGITDFKREFRIFTDDVNVRPKVREYN